MHNTQYFIDKIYERLNQSITNSANFNSHLYSSNKELDNKIEQATNYNETN